MKSEVDMDGLPGELQSSSTVIGKFQEVVVVECAWLERKGRKKSKFFRISEAMDDGDDSSVTFLLRFMPWWNKATKFLVAT